VGQTGRVNTPLTPVGTVQVGSELWTAILDGGGTASKGTEVEVIAVESLRVRVKKVEEAA
jgi:membrane-bound ClpP family serine protease